MPDLLRVLFVEDSPEDALRMSERIAQSGYRVEFERIETALALDAALGGAWDAIVVGVHLPSLNGLAAIEAIRSVDADVPILLVSRTISEDIAAEALRKGAGDVIPKEDLTRLVPALQRELREAEIRRKEKQHERDLRELEAAFRATFERAGVGMAHATPDGGILRVNAAFASMLGYAKAELAGRNFAEITHLDDVVATAAAIRESVSRAGAPVVLEKRYRRRDGEWIWVLATLSFISSGDAAYVIGVFKDISDRKASEHALRESEIRYRLLMEHASEGILIANPRMEVIDLNPAMCALLGGQREEIVGKPLSDFSFPDEPLRVKLMEHRSSAKTRRLDGSSFDAEISSNVLPDGTLEAIFRDVTERNRIEEKLRINEERFRLVAVATNDAVLDVDRVAGTVWTNERYRELFGTPPTGETERLRWREAHIHPEDRARVVSSAYGNPLEGTTAPAIEYRWVREDGTIVPVLERYAVIADANGKIARLIVTIMDLTGQKRAAEALRASEAKFRRVFDSNIVGVHFWRGDGTVTQANDAFLKIAGITREEFAAAGFNWRRSTAPEFVQMSLDRLQQVREKGACSPFEKEYVHRDGKHVRVMMATATLGSPDEGVTVTVDITERQKAIEELRASEARFRATLENSYDLISVIDSTGRVKYESPSVVRVLGYEPEELIGTNAFDRIHPDDRDEIERLFSESVQSASSTATAEFRYQAKDGSWVVLETVGHNLIHEPGIEGIVINSRDVTERRAYEKRLAQSERVAGLGRLAATIAHEFNNVLMGIQPFAEIIRRKSGDETSIANACNRIESSVQRGRRITQEILRFTRPIEPTLAPIPIGEWFAEIAAEMRAVLDAKYRLEIATDEEDAAIAGDRALLTQALTNLIVNARDAMPSGGTIRLSSSATADARMIRIVVTDSGCGIPHRDLERIFEPLYTTKRGGTGLGLPLTQQIVVRHNGSISVESEPGRGTTFHLLLPLYGPCEADAECSCASAGAKASARVLIVEDDAAVAEGIAAILQAEGFETRIAPSVIDAERAIDPFAPHLVLLDVGLPDGDGVELCARLAQRFPQVGFIFCTGEPGMPGLNRIRGTGRPFIQKPFESAALLSTIENVLQPAL